MSKNLTDILFNTKLAGLAYKRENRINEELEKMYLLKSVVAFVEVDNLRAIVVRHSEKVVISIRGTANLGNWLNTNADTKKIQVLEAEGKIHGGFYKATKKLWNLIRKYINKYDIVEIAGHSLGAAISEILGVVMIFYNYIVKNIFAIAQPKIGNKKFYKYSKKILGKKITRVLNDIDIIYNLPLFFMGYTSGDITMFLNYAGTIKLNPSKWYIHTQRFITMFLKNNIIEAGFELAEDHAIKNYIKQLEKV